MQFSIVPDPQGTFATTTGRRVNIVPATSGTDYANQSAFEAKFALVDFVSFTSRLAEIAQARIVAKAAFAALPLGKQSLWEPVRADVDADLVAGKLTAAIERIQSVPVIYEGMEADRAAFLALFGVTPTQPTAS